MNATGVEKRRTHQVMPAREDLVGRALEMASLAELLRSGDRLVTITGPVGIGKSSLAVATVSESMSRLPGHVLYCDFSSLRYPELFPVVLAAGLGVRESGSADVLQALVNRLSSGRTLLVLDHLGHLAAALSDLQVLLDRVAAIQILATASRPLGLADERVFELGPLTFAAPSKPPNSGQITDNASLDLFTTLTRQADSSIDVTCEQASSIAAIVSQLGGNPLAIELAAARGACNSRDADWRELSNALREESPPFQPGERVAQRTIAWSVALLDDSVAGLLVRLSVFNGGFDIAAIRATARSMRTLHIDADAAVQELLDRKLLIAIDSNRFRLPEAVRESGLRSLSSTGNLEGARIAQALHMLDRAEATRSLFNGGRDATALESFERDEANLRAALGTFMATKRHALARRLTAALWQFWLRQRRLFEGDRWLNAAIELFDSADPDSLEPELRFAAAHLALSRNDARAARRHANEGVAVARTLAEEFWRICLLSPLSRSAMLERDVPRSISLATLLLKTIRPHRANHDMALPIETSVRLALSVAYVANAELAEAEYQAREALRICLRQDDAWRAGRARYNLAAIAAERLDIPAALELLRDAMPALWESGDAEGFAAGLLLLATIALSQNKADLAAKLLGGADSIASGTSITDLELIVPDREAMQTRLASLTSQEAITTGMNAGRSAVWSDACSLADEAQNTFANRLAPPKRGVGRFGPDSLSAREREVLCLMVEGMTDRQIADALFIAYRTATDHVNNILGKLEVPNRAAAVAIAVRHGLC